jgi:hypothetical protein
MQITRRKLATAVAAAMPFVGAAPLLAQTVVPQTPPASPQTPPASPDDELKAARDRLKANGDTLAQQTVPMATEPAFQFKA